MIYSHFRDTLLDSISYGGGKLMAVCYDKLFHRMIDKRMTNAQLMSMAGFSPNIITRLKRNEYISLESIEKICVALNCTTDEILEFVSNDNGVQGNE